MGTVTFDCRMFVSLYPEFSTVTPELLTAVFNQATALYLDNTDDSPVTDLKEREQLLFLLVAHLCALRGLGNGRDGQAGLVGRITSASEGSVSVSVDNSGSNDASWWYLQTPGVLTTGRRQRHTAQCSIIPGGHLRDIRGIITGDTGGASMVNKVTGGKQFRQKLKQVAANLSLG
ncbi:Uncharacterised protein [Escherichia coli]|nr:Uncharacterised protein [Escherichia coli]